MNLIIKGQNGRFHQLVRNTEKRRQNRMHRLNLRSYGEVYKNDVDRRAEEIEHLKAKVDKFEELNQENNKNSQILSRLFE